MTKLNFNKIFKEKYCSHIAPINDKFGYIEKVSAMWKDRDNNEKAKQDHFKRALEHALWYSQAEMRESEFKNLHDIVNTMQEAIADIEDQDPDSIVLQTGNEPLGIIISRQT